MDITEKLRVYERNPSPFLQSIQFSRATVSDLLKSMICNILYRNLQHQPVKILDASQTFLLKEFCARYGLSVLAMYVNPFPQCTFVTPIPGMLCSLSVLLSSSTNSARFLCQKQTMFRHSRPG